MESLRSSFLRVISKDNIALGIGILVFVSCLTYVVYKQYEIAHNQLKTDGEVIEFYHTSKARFGLKYRYRVENEEYIGLVGVSPFKCADGSTGCVGQQFTVYYSSINPQYSKIDLGEYEKYKTTVEFFD